MCRASCFPFCFMHATKSQLCLPEEAQVVCKNKCEVRLMLLCGEFIKPVRLLQTQKRWHPPESSIPGTPQCPSGSQCVPEECQCFLQSQLSTGDSPGPASMDLICLPVSRSQRRMWASRELDAAMAPVWLMSTDTTPSWWPSRVHCRSSFSSFLQCKGRKAWLGTAGMTPKPHIKQTIHIPPLVQDRAIQSSHQMPRATHKPLDLKNRQINNLPDSCQVSSQVWRPSHQEMSSTHQSGGAHRAGVHKVPSLTFSQAKPVTEVEHILHTVVRDTITYLQKYTSTRIIRTCFQ